MDDEILCSQPNNDTVGIVQHIKKDLEIKLKFLCTNKGSDKYNKQIKNHLLQLAELPVTVGTLRVTKIGKLMTKLEHHLPTDLASLASSVNEKWKEILHVYREELKKSLSGEKSRLSSKSHSNDVMSFNTSNLYKQSFIQSQQKVTNEQIRKTTDAIQNTASSTASGSTINVTSVSLPNAMNSVQTKSVVKTLQSSILDNRMQSSRPHSRTQTSLPDSRIQRSILNSQMPSSLPDRTQSATLDRQIQSSMADSRMQQSIQNSRIQSSIPDSQSKIRNSQIHSPQTDNQMHSSVLNSLMHSSIPDSRIQLSMPDRQMQSSISDKSSISDSRMPLSISDRRMQPSVPVSLIQSSLPNSRMQSSMDSQISRSNSVSSVTQSDIITQKMTQKIEESKHKISHFSQMFHKILDSNVSSVICLQKECVKVLESLHQMKVQIYDFESEMKIQFNSLCQDIENDRNVLYDINREIRENSCQTITKNKPNVLPGFSGYSNCQDSNYPLNKATEHHVSMNEKEAIQSSQSNPHKSRTENPELMSRIGQDSQNIHDKNIRKNSIPSLAPAQNTLSTSQNNATEKSRHRQLSRDTTTSDDSSLSDSNIATNFQNGLISVNSVLKSISFPPKRKKPGTVSKDCPIPKKSPVKEQTLKEKALRNKDEIKTNSKSKDNSLVAVISESSNLPRIRISDPDSGTETESDTDSTRKFSTETTNLVESTNNTHGSSMFKKEKNIAAPIKFEINSSSSSVVTSEPVLPQSEEIYIDPTDSAEDQLLMAVDLVDGQAKTNTQTKKIKIEPDLPRSVDNLASASANRSNEIFKQPDMINIKNESKPIIKRQISSSIPALSCSSSERQNNSDDDLLSFSQQVCEMTEEINESDKHYLMDDQPRKRANWNNMCKRQQRLDYAPLTLSNGRMKAAHHRPVGKEAIHKMLKNEKEKKKRSNNGRDCYLPQGRTLSMNFFGDLTITTDHKGKIIRNQFRKH